MLISPRYAWFCEPILAITFPLESSGWDAALRLFSYSKIRFSGNRDSPVFNWLLRMKSAYFESREEMPLPFRVDEGGVGDSGGADGARRNAGQTRPCGATRTFTRNLNRRISAGGGLGRERRGIQDGVGKA